MTSPSTPDAPTTPGDVGDGSAPGSGAAARAAREKIIVAGEGALKRYRFMAYVTGVMLLLLCVEMVLVYGLRIGPDAKRFIAWIPFAHGWIYVVYLITVVDLWSKMRWAFGRLVVMVLGGVVPVMSFVVEKRVHADADAKIAAARAA
ncbi:DUF3817 domain-containing protein [Sanguibacter antarcticus]|uniref:Integral membrane protein n=1 Tax=Sanguibacter antarcticus TaxID=372484 RepID=A0A2A9E6T5_9MICO|nr:DUF3817 domain-containing protein [Sanguibacter antarcticus]PFG33942.1 integral membrane protein [Sanguibacter antarcticus]